VKRLPTLLRIALAITAGLLFAFAAATPASAGPTQFTVVDVGEDICTHYESTGTADWPDIVVAPTVEIEGVATTYLEGSPCLDVVPQDRHIEFLAYDRKDVVDARSIPLSGREDKFEYAFALRTSEDRAITHVTVAICITDSDIGIPVHDCTEPVVIKAG
jgi:hypothetical protein